MSSVNRSFLPPLSRCQPSLHTPHPPFCPTCWCTRFDLFVLSSSPGVPDVVEPALKRQHLSNAGDSEAPSWLKEIHSKIWSCKKLESELFQTVKVTRADYDKLQGDLKEKHPGRDSPQYDGKMVDVRSEKTCFPSVDVDDGPEASNEDDSEINSLFPFTLRYMDLSTLELKHTSDRFPSSLFIREEYDHISKLISEQPKTGKGSVIVSGQPGTGEVLISLSRRI